jgi:glyoxylase-like metal-dependent hydrolase (beta-lactamase superfamily II)
MEEILPGIFHWTTFHEGIGQKVHSYFLAYADPPVLIDPRVPEEGLAWFGKSEPPVHVFLTNRHHYRHSDRFEKAFGTKVWCHRAGLHEFTPEQKVHPFLHGDELPGGILALAVGVLCPEETALFFSRSGGILAIGDAIVRYGTELGFVPDSLMGENPEEVRRGLKKVFLGHLEREFDHLLFAHGQPWVGGARKELRRFLEGLPD